MISRRLIKIYSPRQHWLGACRLYGPAHVCEGLPPHAALFGFGSSPALSRGRKMREAEKGRPLSPFVSPAQPSKQPTSTASPDSEPGSQACRQAASQPVRPSLAQPVPLAPSRVRPGRESEPCRTEQIRAEKPAGPAIPASPASPSQLASQTARQTTS